MKKPLFFVGIRWKIWVPLLATVLFLNFGLYSYLSLQLKQQYQSVQQESFKKNLKVLDGVLTNSYYKLLEVGQTIVLMSQANKVSDSPSHQMIESTLGVLFPQFETQGILDGVAIFNLQGELQLSLGNIDIRSNSIVQSVLKSEHPVRQISCENQCFRTISIPLLNAGKIEGVLVLGRLMQDIVLDFKQLTAVEIGIARKDANSLSDMSAWSLDFKQLTQRNRNIQILQSLSQQVLEISNDQLYMVDVFNSKYEVFFTVPASAAPTSMIWVLITDGTSRYNEVQALKEQLAVGLMITSLLLLSIAFFVTLKATRRLQKTRFVANENVIQAFVMRDQKRLFPDEISEIYKCVNALYIRRDGLIKNGQNANQRIDDLIKELAKEKEKVAHLMGNSQNIIITQSTDGRMLTVNDVGRELFGLSQTHEPRLFADLFLSGESNHEATNGINRLYMGLDRLICSGSQSFDLQGRLRDFSWVHSYIDECSEHRSVILSIGMDITAKKQAENDYSLLASHGSLTEIVNKDIFLEKLPKLMEDSLNNQRLLAVLCCEVKSLCENLIQPDLFDNDSVLSTAVAERILSCLRVDDMVAKFDNQLYTVVLEGLKVQNSAGEVAQKIITAFVEPFRFSDSVSIVDINIGISIFPEQATGVTEIVGHAEVAMGFSKESGVNNYQYYRLGHPLIN